MNRSSNGKQYLHVFHHCNLWQQSSAIALYYRPSLSRVCWILRLPSFCGTSPRGGWHLAGVVLHDHFMHRHLYWFLQLGTKWLASGIGGVAGSICYLLYILYTLEPFSWAPREFRPVDAVFALLTLILPCEFKEATYYPFLPMEIAVLFFSFYSPWAVRSRHHRIAIVGNL